MGKAVDRDDAVAGGFNCADLRLLRLNMETVDRGLEHRHDAAGAVARTVISVSFLPCGVDTVFELSLATAGTPVILVASYVQNKAAVNLGFENDLEFDIFLSDTVFRGKKFDKFCLLLIAGFRDAAQNRVQLLHVYIRIIAHPVILPSESRHTASHRSRIPRSWQQLPLPCR